MSNKPTAELPQAKAVRVTDDVDEKDMGDLQTNLSF